MPIARRHAAPRVQWALMHAFFSRFGWQILGVLCLAGAVALGVAVHTYHILPMDTAIYDWIHTHISARGSRRWSVRSRSSRARWGSS